MLVEGEQDHSVRVGGVLEDVSKDEQEKLREI